MKILKYALFLGIILALSGCTGSVYVDDGVVRTEAGESIVNNDTKALQVEDITLRLATGTVEGFEAVHKFGGGDLSTTFKPVTRSGFYRTPTSAIQLEFVSDSVNDTYLGAGARQITIQGLNASWDRIQFVINTSGTTPVTLPYNMTRVFRWWVSSSGTYATQSQSSHLGELTIREVGGGDIWSIIPVAPYPLGQSEIGAYSIPRGYTGYILRKSIYTDTTKTADFYFYAREHADDVTAPYNGTMRLIEREVGVSGAFGFSFFVPKGPIVGPADVGYIGSVSSGTSDVSSEFELILVKIPE